MEAQEQTNICAECNAELDEIVIECCKHKCARCKKVICEDCGVYFDNMKLVCKECSQYFTKDGETLEE